MIESQAKFRNTVFQRY